MVDQVNRIGLSNIGPISGSNIGNLPPQFLGIGGASYHEKFIFPEDEKILDMGKSIFQDEILKREHREILILLLSNIVNDNIIIEPTPPRSVNNAIIEASLIQDPAGKRLPRIKIPIRGVNNILSKQVSIKEKLNLQDWINDYVDQILRFTTDIQLLRLIIILSHEYGHYLSYIRGNHTKDLKTALYLLKIKQTDVLVVNQYLWLIFREETTAWALAQKLLTGFAFNLWADFIKIKNNSLSAYIKILNLKLANIDTMCKLSYLGDDFHDNCPSFLT